MKDEISEYYSRARARIKALESQIKEEKELRANWNGRLDVLEAIDASIERLEIELERARQID